MTDKEMMLASYAQDCGFVLVQDSSKWRVRDFEGTEFGPWTGKEMLFWLRGFACGMNAHAPGCQCGRFECSYRNRVTGNTR